MRDKLKKIFTAAALMLALGCVTELTGYSWFDEEDGSNAMCDLDPTCRNLTPKEIDLAKEFFGSSVDYKHVKVFSRNFFFYPFEGAAMVPNGNIYMLDDRMRNRTFDGSPDKDTGIFIHEMTHVWQHQQGVSLPLSALAAYIENGFDYAACYEYCVDKYAKFDDYNIEQQASIVENIYNMRYVTKPEDIASDSDYCTALRKHEEKAAQDLPLKPTKACRIKKSQQVPLI